MRIKLFLIRYFELILYTAIYIAASLLVLQAFFDNIYVSSLLCSAGIYFYIRKINNYISWRRQQRIENEFYALLRQLSMAMSSGATIENAVREAAIADRKLYKTIGSELERTYRMISNHYSPDFAFRVLSDRCRNEEIRTFAEVLAAGIPAGINLAQLIRYMSVAFRLKSDVEHEIQKTLNAPKYNNRIIMAMPFVCVIVFRCVAPSYMAPLYHGYGRAVMIAVFILILSAGWIGSKLSDIRL